MKIKKQLERDKVLKPCIKSCKWMLDTGQILQYRRMDESDRDHKVGAPDIEVWLEKNDLVWILMVECKKPDGGTLRTKQKEYRDRFNKYKNVTYIVVKSVKEMNSVINQISDFYDEQDKELEDLIKLTP